MVSNRQIQNLIRATNNRLAAALNDLEQKAETGELVHQRVTSANVELRETIQLYLVVQRVFQEVMPVLDEVGRRLTDQLNLQEAIEGHAYEEMSDLKATVYEFRNLATLSNNLFESIQDKLGGE